MTWFHEAFSPARRFFVLPCRPLLFKVGRFSYPPPNNFGINSKWHNPVACPYFLLQFPHCHLLATRRSTKELQLSELSFYSPSLNEHRAIYDSRISVKINSIKLIMKNIYNLSIIYLRKYKSIYDESIIYLSQISFHFY